ncbi:MAG TPA: oligosaccharide flippase family protein [Bacteroidales bacterium]|nr:oligosaccharide flippase family protein [Bacteroidales bacterium]
MNHSPQNKFYRDFLWYFIGSIIPAIIVLIRLPIFTRHFSPEEYGYYTLVTSTFAYLSIMLFSWISSCLWRFYTEAEKGNTLNALCSNLVFLSLVSSLLMLFITAFWLVLVKSTLVYRLVFLSFLQLTSGQALSLYLVIVRIKERAFFYNLINSLQAIGAFALLFYFAFSLNLRIESILMGQVIMNVLLILVVLMTIKKFPRLSLTHVTAKSVRELLTYGAVGLYTGFCVLLLISSDRYIIALFSDIGSVGIYNQVYMLGQFSIYHLVTVYFNTINPRLIRILTYKPDDLNEQITGYIRFFIIIILPLVFCFSIFSRQMAQILLGEKFRIGYRMIPFIMTSSFIYGLILFNEAKLKFENRFRSLITGMTVACLANILLNFLLVPVWGYQAAAWTTLFSYLILYAFLYFADSIRYLNIKLMKSLLPAFIILLVQLGLDLLFRQVFRWEINEWFTILEGIVFLSAYIFLNRKHTHHIVLLFKS